MEIKFRNAHFRNIKFFSVHRDLCGCSEFACRASQKGKYRFRGLTIYFGKYRIFISLKNPKDCPFFKKGIRP